MDTFDFDPILCRGDFDYDRDGTPMIFKDAKSGYVDKFGNKVTQKGFLIDEEGNVIDIYGKKKFDQFKMNSDGDLPKLINFNGRTFDILDVSG